MSQASSTAPRVSVVIPDVRWALCLLVALNGCSSDDTSSCDTRDYCCCQGDVLDFPICANGAPACKSGYTLNRGDACKCLPDRDTPCCLPHARIDSGPPRDALVDANECRGACCCQGDVKDSVQCTAGGPVCKADFVLYYGTDCECLPDRNTPCCFNRPLDVGAGD